MIRIRLSKKAQVDFRFIAKYPAAIFAAGGLLCIILEKNGWATTLIVLAVALHLLWLKR